MSVFGARNGSKIVKTDPQAWFSIASSEPWARSAGNFCLGSGAVGAALPNLPTPEGRAACGAYRRVRRKGGAEGAPGPRGVGRGADHGVENEGP